MKLLSFSWVLFFSLSVFSQTRDQLAKQVSDLYLTGDPKKALPLAEQGRALAEKELGTKDPNYGYWLNVLGLLYRELGDYKKAEQNFQGSLEIIVNTIGKKHPNYRSHLTNLANLYRDMREYEKSKEAYQEVLELIKTSKGENDPEYAKLLNGMGLLYIEKSDFKNAEQNFLKAIQIWKVAKDESNDGYAAAQNNLGTLYTELGDYKNAEISLLKSVEVYRRITNGKGGSFANSLNSVGVLYSKMGQFKKAESYYLSAIAIRRETYGDKHIDVANSLGNMARLYAESGQYKKSEEFSLTEIAIYKEVVGEDHPIYANGINGLGVLYKETGQLEKALPLLLKANRIYATERSIKCGYTLNNLAGAYADMGQSQKAEGYYNNARKLIAGAFGRKNPLYAITLNNMAVFYSSINQNQKAESVMLEAISIQKEKLGENHPDYAISLDNLAQIYIAALDYKKALPLVLKAADIRRTALGNDHPNYAISLRTLSKIYQATGQLKEAEACLAQAADIMKTKYGESNANYSSSLNALGLFYLRKGELGKAEDLLVKSADIDKNVLGEKHPHYANELDNLSELFQRMRNYQKAEYYSMLSNRITMENTLNTFSILSEKEKNALLQGGYNRVEYANSLTYKNPGTSKEFRSFNLNYLLLLKSLALTETKNMLDVVRKSSDKDLHLKLYQWENNKMMLSKEYSLPVNKRKADLKIIEEETENLEKELSRRSMEFREQRDAIQPALRLVQQNLKREDATIEFVRFRLFDENWTSTVLYAAYILTGKDSVPVFVPVCNEKDLERVLNTGTKDRESINMIYRGGKESNNGREQRILGDTLFKLVWQPLEPYLKDIKKIHYSPAGKLYSIAFHALPTGKDQLLMDKYNLQQYTSTKQVAFSKRVERKPTSIGLFGDAKFSMDSLELVKSGQSGQPVYFSPTPSGTRGKTDSWIDLPGTAFEINSIEELFNKNSIPVQKFTKQSASETNLKKISTQSPDVIHLATHGFFLPEQKTASLADDPLLRNGLVLAGANYSWGGKPPILGMDDGVITAYEISQLDLSKTRLVVLSACETALGDIKGTEGVFGLQRGFKLAGVDNLIVSLWQVPDRETAELMTQFYSNWLNGKTIRESFNAAQAEMRKKKYPPYFWAAFVLIE